MAFINTCDRDFLTAISKLDYCNPFTRRRIDCEREALGDQFVEAEAIWSNRPDLEHERANIGRLIERVEPTVEQLRKRLVKGVKARDGDLVLYEDLVMYQLYHRYRLDLHEHILRTAEGKDGQLQRVRCYTNFAGDFGYYLKLANVQMPTQYAPAHMFAIFFQIRRAFHHIFHHIIGGSMPAARLRAAVWQSIVTHDMHRYRRILYDKMGDITTLVTGQSGTGKELVARAIGLSRYIPFDPKTQKFVENFAESFHALNLSALSPTLIESELFGHKRGAFTGALADHTGWMELCSPLGTVFLDEIGDLDASIQVKLLRVLQMRTFQCLGDTKTKRFEGKIIAATNRNLTAEMHANRFREDFYYRLCSDMITTPSLHEQIADSPGELQNLILYIAKRLTGSVEAETLANEVETWIDQHLDRDYRWPGNIRELEQCVWNVLIRNEYHPPRSLVDDGGADSIDALTADMRAVKLTADELLCRYCTLAYAQTGSYEQAARQLQLDRRTVKRKIDDSLLEQFKASS